MNRWLCYILGIMTGIVFSVFFAVFASYNNSGYYNNPYGIEGLNMPEKKGDCIISNNLEIFQTLTTGLALARPIGKFDTLVLLIDDSRPLFYDGEVIKNPAGKCARQVGTYSYETKAEVQKTVPAVIIDDK